MIGTAISTWIAATLTIAIFSFLFRDNPLYRLAEHLYVGISAAYTVIVVFWYQDAWPLLVDGFRDNLAQGNRVEAWLLAVPAVLGILMWTRFSPRISWVSRIPLAFTIGIGAGLGITGSIHGYILPQLKGALQPLVAQSGEFSFGHFVVFVVIVSASAYATVFRRWSAGNQISAAFWSMLTGTGLYLLLFEILSLPALRRGLSFLAADNLVNVIATVTTLLYFYFSHEHKGVLGVGSRVGIAVIMLSFGASFGYTVMARISLLIGRCYFLFHEWGYKGIVEPLKVLFR